MTLLWLPAGIILPTLCGWLLLRLLEGRTLVLLWLERLALGFLLGLTLTMFVTFLVHIAGLILFTRFGFLSVQGSLTFLLLLLRILQWHLFPNPNPSPNPIPLPRSDLSPEALAKGEVRIPKSVSVLLVLLAIWTIAKIAFGSFILATTPPYFDDTLKNWNYRAKVFFTTQTIDIGQMGGEDTGPLSSYPPTVSLAKASLASFAGQWHEGLVNSIHLLWFLASLALLYGVLQRQAGPRWALLGVYLLASLPLSLFHGVNAYADVFLSAHLFAAGSLIWSALTEPDAARRSSFLRLGALALGLLIFTKNEALVLYLPILLALLIGSLIVLNRRGRMTGREVRATLAWTVGWLLAIGCAWVTFKWTYGLGFGNAKSLSSSYEFGWQPGVLYALWVNTFFEGNWHLLFPAFLLLLVLQGKQILRSPLAPLVLLVLVAILLQVSLFLFTSLSAEALRQTGLARGFVQLAPLVVMLVVLLTRDAMNEQ
ncbi:MAG TPA: hypothetical protein DEB30_05380 [Candidatus Peribacter riflensis]|uniref:Glycosyltransferase RgtA/B/C/D-like domain-containing protein n=1 Tax=Candidatus Peribacter riflensis TaxID=1735162 RepID=A0A0S1SNC0_9BACT|nr:MAG: hypothetical protein PeribacterA2_0119 [Candidatus Peribacter riflensis]OGJ76695.1 MAG: hypothetical protein A2398_03645 [Candidatus Peribacteria bacterium RIFOXYB1_FULL_57_12]ALM10616.1 MAG: hypothetical protein PeribacterB2_0119 [Candidatus Peribacter riflensis]ALM11718.1 MAG: hypothetical protein PeribacterC2_0118 [Candidatus Peribacter riflensis]ALM12821.1 MAG: hypothetical protein PeribacterD1_0119 [Candidatus Peribacter riflensis]